MKLPPVAVLAGIAALVVIALVGFMLINGSKSGGIIFRPSTVSCSRPPAEFAWTIKLPASVKAGDKLTMWVDNESTSMPLTMFKQHADGSWIWEFSSSNTTQNCTSKGSTPGKHTMQIRDASGKVLAEGTLEVTP